MTEERRQELHAKYSELFDFAAEYSCLLSDLKGMVNEAYEVCVCMYCDNAIGYIDCLGDLDIITSRECFDLIRCLQRFRNDILGIH